MLAYAHFVYGIHDHSRDSHRSHLIDIGECAPGRHTWP